MRAWRSATDNFISPVGFANILPLSPHNPANLVRPELRSRLTTHQPPNRRNPPILPHKSGHCKGGLKGFIRATASSTAEPHHRNCLLSTGEKTFRRTRVRSGAVRDIDGRHTVVRSFFEGHWKKSMLPAANRCHGYPDDPVICTRRTNNATRPPFHAETALGRSCCQSQTSTVQLPSPVFANRFSGGSTAAVLFTPGAEH